jgi:hypothetical protein
MNDQEFLANYLWPSDDKLDRTFAHLLPNIGGLKKYGDFIVQCELDDTFSTNIMTKYKSDISEVKLMDVHKNTQNKVTGVFTRLVGTMSLVKTGYPFLVLDAPVRNATVVTAEAERKDITIDDITTMVFILLPQADPVQRQLFFSRLREQVKESGISYQERQSDILPGFYGPTLLVESKGIELDLIRKLRDYAWNSYKDVIEQTKEKSLFDYRPFQEHMIFDTAQREHLSFSKRGLSVPVEAQAAFFSVMVSGT